MIAPRKSKASSDNLFRQESAALWSDVVQQNVERRKIVNVIDKTTFSNKSDPVCQFFHVQLRSQGVNRENQETNVLSSNK